jgi:hypothetical protein
MYIIYKAIENTLCGAGILLIPLIPDWYLQIYAVMEDVQEEEAKALVWAETLSDDGPNADFSWTVSLLRGKLTHSKFYFVVLANQNNRIEHHRLIFLPANLGEL